MSKETESIPLWKMLLPPILTLGAISGCTFVFVKGMDADDRVQAQRVAEREAKVEAALDGCQITDMGEYRGVRHLIVVRCNERKTTSTNYEIPQAKTSEGVSILSLDQLK